MGTASKLASQSSHLSGSAEYNSESEQLSRINNMVQAKSVVFFSLVLVSSCSLISGGVTPSEDMARGFGLECEGSYSLACFKKDIVHYIEKISSLDEVNILPGMTVVKDESANVTKTSEMVAGKVLYNRPEMCLIDLHSYSKIQRSPATSPTILPSAWTDSCWPS